MLYLYLIHNPSGFISKLGHSFHETETSIIIIYILLLLFELSQKFLSFCVLAKQKKALKISGQIATDHIHLGML